MVTIHEHQAPDLTVAIGDLTLRNPVLTASGTFGYGKEFEDFVNLNDLGGVIVKGISREPRGGNKPPRIVETACGMLNAIGLENVGLDAFVRDKMVFLREYDTNVIVNILGDTLEDYAYLAEKLNEINGLAGIEINISCPNVKKGGVAFGTDPQMAYSITKAVKDKTRLPVITKLSPNVTDVTMIAKAAEDGGADAVSLINTVLGMAINANTRKPMLANIVGGLSGPAIKPIALRMVWQTAKAVTIPVIGIGGITTAQDAVEFLIAGASAIQIGTANFIDPGTTGHISKEIAEYMRNNQMSSMADLIGSLSI